MSLLMADRVEQTKIAAVIPNPRKAGEVDEATRPKNCHKSEIRAQVEHVFAVVEYLWDFTKVDYGG